MTNFHNCFILTKMEHSSSTWIFFSLYKKYLGDKRPETTVQISVHFEHVCMPMWGVGAFVPLFQEPKTQLSQFVVIRKSNHSSSACNFFSL